MDVNQTSAIAPAHPDSRQQNQARNPPSEKPKHDKQDDAPSGSWRDLEAVDFDHGLIDALTPEIQGVIDALNKEIEPLRRQLASANHQIEELKRGISQHSFLNVANRLELFRELEHVLANQAVFTVPPTLALLHVTNADRIRREFGRAKLDAYLFELSNRVRDGIRQTDSFGNIGGNDFALIILGVEIENAKREMAELVTRITSTPVHLGQIKVDAEISVGVASLEDVSSIEMALQKADTQIVAPSIVAPSIVAPSKER